MHRRDGPNRTGCKAFATAPPRPQHRHCGCRGRCICGSALSRCGNTSGRTEDLSKARQGLDKSADAPDPVRFSFSVRICTSSRISR